MSKIHTLKISNFRGLKSFNQVFGLSKFICFIGRGDSGKTTILDAISYVLSPSWNLSFYDTDFYNTDVSNSITIEAIVYDLPLTLLKESKFGLMIEGMDQKTTVIHAELEDHHIPVLTVKLIVESDLEPKWYVINGRQEALEIKSSDRASFNVFLVSEYLDRHFSWSKGNPLYSLLQQGDQGQERKDIFIEAFRDAKSKIDLGDFSHLENVVNRIKGSAQKLGIDIANATTTIDFKDIIIKDGRICLHEDKIPFRLKGKGSKRLISIAIQMELSTNGGILLIDEIEQGLEPDRVQHVANYLKQNNTGQIFLTTHSSAVLVELDAIDLYKVVSGCDSALNLSSDLQGAVRKNPEAFFAEKILVCEGLTEIGICRALNNYNVSNGKKNAALKGIRIANGSGSTLINYAIGLKKVGFSVGLFCDSDVKNVNDQKNEMISLGIEVFDTEDSLCIEDQIFKDLPWEAVKELIQYHINGKDEKSVVQSIETKYGKTLEPNWLEQDNILIRVAIAKAACIKDKEWFKRTDHGAIIGNVCFKYFSEMKVSKLKTLLQNLIDWFGND